MQLSFSYKNHISRFSICKITHIAVHVFTVLHKTWGGKLGGIFRITEVTNVSTERNGYCVVQQTDLGHTKGSVVF